MKNFKSLLILGLVIAAIAIIAIIYTVLFSNPKTEPIVENTNTPIESNTNTNTPPANNSLKTYNGANYTYKYPNTLTETREDLTYLPYDNQEVQVDAGFMHESKTQYCAPSGECTPTTRDFSFNNAVINSSLAQIKAKLGAEAKTITLGNYSVLTVTQGVEGEGISYYFIAMPNNKTLMFDQRFIDESVNPKYQKVSDFIPYAQQNRMMWDIISSLTFTK